MCHQSNPSFISSFSEPSVVNIAKGFTMVELLVTLVLLGLIASVVAPGLESWLSSRQAAVMRMALANELALLPIKANRTGQQIIIDDVSQLNIDDLEARFTIPVLVLANGYCQGGQVTIIQRGVEVPFDVTAPYCEVRRRAVL